jgi:hypothetical protein
MNTLAIAPTLSSAPTRPQAAHSGATAPRLPVWDERARKMGFPPSTR